MLDYIGDFEEYKIFSLVKPEYTYYGIGSGENIFSYIKTHICDGNEIIDYVFTGEKYRGQKFGIKLLFFLKAFLCKSFIIQYMEDNSIDNFIDALYKVNRFVIKWRNTKNGTIYEYKPESHASYSAWQILINGHEKKVGPVFYEDNPHYMVRFFNGF